MALRAVNVLLVEDDEDDVYIAKQVMDNDPFCQYQLTHLSTYQALLQADVRNIDIILLDLGLPDASGLNLVAEVVNHFRDIPVVVLTGLTSEKLGEQAIQIGAEDYIPKEELASNLLSRSVRFAIERHGMVNKLRNMVHVDGLTLLSNRTDFDERLDSLMDFAQRHQSKLGLLLIDLDGFKEINDSLGHSAGDKVLIQFAARLKSHIRKTDVAARIGGDEFALILHPVDSVQACEQFTKLKLEHINEPFLIYADGNVKKVSIGMSVGIALYPEHGDSVNLLRDNADKAMYEVKKRGKNSYLVFNPAL
mgnify:CR=1 FL=1